MDLLRFVTTGSVDDGKSTLIGRLLFDTKSIYDDQIESIVKTSQEKGYGYTNLALLTDGLRSEREQGITIDVAYRYFSTKKRKFIIADTPGHIQYTRNMVTGASTADLALLMIDARKGVIEQTRRHSLLTSLLGIKHLVLCVNKMDLVGNDEKIFEEFKHEFYQFSLKLKIPHTYVIPMSALNGDNIVEPSKNIGWYKGKTLLETLEEVVIKSDTDKKHGRFPVQYVIRPYSNEWHDFRGYAGRLESGIFKPGDAVVGMQSGIATKIKSIETANGQLKEALPNMSVLLTLQDDIDISRGDMIVPVQSPCRSGQELQMMICWMSEKKLKVGGKYLLQQATKRVKCVVSQVSHKIDINTLEENDQNLEVSTNDIAKVSVTTSEPLFFDSYSENRFTGAAILIDEFTNETVAGCMLD